MIRRLAAPALTALAVAAAVGVWLGRAIDRATRSIGR